MDLLDIKLTPVSSCILVAAARRGRAVNFVGAMMASNTPLLSVTYDFFLSFLVVLIFVYIVYRYLKSLTSWICIITVSDNLGPGWLPNLCFGRLNKAYCTITP
jgi:hypothetical protein